ncbi:hypothetical protein GMORB2_0134 [Geosmithia morbida]|uniref:Uncharacterized protein n=1 Tax=Geosmithia morbida TaxID=1094350 RepID=A0A9P4Z0E3_9HYPO|nr:uncharacterized protein GMORB2_0134 [Geosmithia morbida]KAF4126398.1 hypothetical protein GMORB2_0134 [Geosmithia morbida]
MAKASLFALMGAAMPSTVSAAEWNYTLPLPAAVPRLDLRGTINDGLLEALPMRTNYTIEPWGYGWIPKDCKREIEAQDYKSVDVEVFNVFGRMPLDMREFVSEVILLPSFVYEESVAHTSSEGSITFQDDGLFQTVMAHEMSHQLDWYGQADITGGGGAGAPFSNSKIWQDNYNLDTACVTDYARTKWSEDFAESGAMGLYDRLVPGGLRAAYPSTDGAYHQLHTFETYMESYIAPKPKSTCTHRRSNGEAVPLTESMRALGKKPDTSFASFADVEVLPRPEESFTLCYPL